MPLVSSVWEVPARLPVELSDEPMAPLLLPGVVPVMSPDGVPGALLVVAGLEGVVLEGDVCEFIGLPGVTSWVLLPVRLGLVGPVPLDWASATPAAMPNDAIEAAAKRLNDLLIS